MLPEVLDSVYREVTKIAQRGDFAVLDFDGTCIEGDIGEAVFFYMCENGLLRNDRMLGDRGGRLGKPEYHERVFNRFHRLTNNVRNASLFAYAALAGYNPAEVRDIFNRTLEYEGQEIGSRELFDREISNGIRVREDVKDLILRLGDIIIPSYVVTASAQILVEFMLDKYFSDCSCSCLGITSEQEVDGVFTDRIIGPVTVLGGKVQGIKTHISTDQRPILGAGDSPNDEPMLEYSKVRLVVGNGKLAETARQKGWFVFG